MNKVDAEALVRIHNERVKTGELIPVAAPAPATAPQPVTQFPLAPKKP